MNHWARMLVLAPVLSERLIARRHYHRSHRTYALSTVRVE